MRQPLFMLIKISIGRVKNEKTILKKDGFS